MTYSYFPGCTLKTKAKQLDEYARKSAQALGVTLEELPDWQCCGGVYPMARDEIATRLASVRALLSAGKQGRDLVTVCSACHHVIKRVNGDMAQDPDMRAKVKNYMQLEREYAGETRVVHYLELLRDDIGFEKVKAAVVKPLTGKKIAAYYGCLLLRPSREMQFDNPENPSVLEDFIRALGAVPVVYPYRNECCGGYISVEHRSTAQGQCDQIMASASENGAEAVITACPLCMYNLNANSTENRLPVYYFTELLAEALGLK